MLELEGVTAMACVQMMAECQAWLGVAKSHEIVAAGFRAMLDQMLHPPAPSSWDACVLRAAAHCTGHHPSRPIILALPQAERTHIHAPTGDIWA